MSGSPWFPFERLEVGAPARVFCFAHAGSGASWFRAWRTSSTADLDIVPVQLPGRESRIREQPRTHIEDLLPELIEALVPRCDRPFALFGHSLGALVTYRLAAALDPAVARPWRLFVSGSGPPHPGRSSSGWAHLDDALLVARVRSLGGLPDEVLEAPELLQMVLPVLRADLSLGDSCDRSTPRLRVPITAFGGRADPLVTASELEAWGALTSGPFAMRLFDGGHFFLHEHGREVRVALRDGMPSVSAG